MQWSTFNIFFLEFGNIGLMNKGNLQIHSRLYVQLLTLELGCMMFPLILFKVLILQLILLIIPQSIFLFYSKLNYNFAFLWIFTLLWLWSYIWLWRRWFRWRLFRVNLLILSSFRLWRWLLRGLFRWLFRVWRFPVKFRMLLFRILFCLNFDICCLCLLQRL